jgi:hypothetical protein
MVTVIDQGNEDFEVIAFESWDENGEYPIDVGSYDTLKEATNALRSTVKTIEAGQDSDLPIPAQEDSPISDIISGIFECLCNT